jgi:hypothetical protein
MNIHFDHEPATSSTHEVWRVRCDELHDASLGLIFEYFQGQTYVYQTESWNPYARSRNKRSRRARSFVSLDDAKAAAVAYVARKVKQARDEQPVQYGHGRYFKIRTRWYYAYDVNGGATSPQPARSKKDAKERLLSVPSWVNSAVETPVCGHTGKPIN